jgi:hypothetical protein
MELRLYISGRVTGEDLESCRNKFAAAELKLRNLGVKIIINPMKLGIPERWKWQDAMDVCMKVLEEKANSIFLLNDWVKSQGAKEEHDFARKNHYEIFNEDDTEEIVRYLELPHKKEGVKWIDTSEHEFP